ncbi:MAG: beta-galactosidase trimerization domain-containing protein [Phycisphaerae bacterium]
MKLSLAFTASVVAAICLLAPGPSAVAGENLLKNGGFEELLPKPDDQGNPFKDWTGRKWQGLCRVDQDTDIRHEGKASARFSSNGGCKIAIIQDIKTKAGFYKLSGYIRAIGLTPGQYGWNVLMSFEPKKEYLHQIPGGTYGWRKFEIVQKLDEDYDKTPIYIYLFGSGKFWVDDLKVEKVEGEDLKSGVTLGEVEEKFKGYEGEGGLKCPSCGLMVDPKAAKCPVCGEPTEGLADYSKANAAYAKVMDLIKKAQDKNIDVLYWQAAAIPMRVGLNERWNGFPSQRPDILEYVGQRGGELVKEITDVLDGKRQPRVVPPKPDFTRMKLKGRDFIQGDEPKLIYGVHDGPTKETQPFFVQHREYVYTCMAPGADRFNYKQMPIWDAFNKYPDTHRVWGGGWCGHLIADKWSGGVSGANIVICLESQHTRDACVEAYKKVLPGQTKSKTRQVSLLDYEYFYICYCDATRDMFRNWLKDKFGTVDKLNAAWGTGHKDFSEVELPGYRQSEPNDAKRYDWFDFNIWRFTQFMVWAKSEQRKIDPDVPMATCAPHYNFTKEWGESGSDVESMANSVNDFCINESPASTKYVDFLRSITDNKKAIVEVEGSEYRNTMASFLHGLSALSLYWAWADQPGDGGALLYGRGNREPFCTLPEAEQYLRTGLDIRRLGKEIIAFQRDQAAPVALLYSKASMLQVPKAGGNKTPYLLELEHSYDALLELGVPVDFITTKQVHDGKLSQYKVLVIPAATYEHASVVEKVVAFAKSGGQVVLVPNSWFFDQYNRKQDYLGSLGVTVASMKAPLIKSGTAKTGIERDVSGEETEAPFLMGLIVDTVVTDVPKAKIKTAKAGLFADGETVLQGAGVRHVAKVAGAGKTIATFDDGNPAIAEVPMEKGAIYYLAIPLAPDSMTELVDRLVAKAGVKRDVKFLSPDGKRVPGLEYRAVKAADGWLAYVNNLDRKDARQVKLAGDIKFTGIRNLTLDEDLPLTFTLPAGETWILKLRE